MPELVRGNVLPAQWEKLSDKTKAELINGRRTIIMREAWLFCDLYEAELKRLAMPHVTFVVQPEFNALHGAHIDLAVYAIDGTGASLDTMHIVEPFEIFPTELAQTKLTLILGEAPPDASKLKAEANNHSG